MLHSMNVLEPRRPSNLPDYAEVCLLALVEHGLADKLSLGGALGLLHYIDYRQTNDVDAWWSPETTPAERQAVVTLLATSLQPYGEVLMRTWGEVVSIELKQAERKTFSFQIAQREVQLAPSVQAPWVEVPLDSLADLLASKMVALVERGAPRDFRDIDAVCQAGLATPTICWELWRQRQIKARSDASVSRAQLAIHTHLARIIQHRPLDEIVDVEARQAAAQVREWFIHIFLPAGGESL